MARKQPQPIHQLTMAQFERMFPDEDAGAGHMTAPEQVAKTASKALAGGGRRHMSYAPRIKVNFPTPQCPMPKVTPLSRRLPHRYEKAQKIIRSGLRLLAQLPILSSLARW